MGQISVDLKPGVLAVIREQLKPIEERIANLERIVKEQQAELERLRDAK